MGGLKTHKHPTQLHLRMHSAGGKRRGRKKKESKQNKWLTENQLGHTLSYPERAWEMHSSYWRTDGSPNLLRASVPKDKPATKHLAPESRGSHLEHFGNSPSGKWLEGKLRRTNISLFTRVLIKVIGRPLAAPVQIYMLADVTAGRTTALKAGVARFN